MGNEIQGVIIHVAEILEYRANMSHVRTFPPVDFQLQLPEPLNHAVIQSLLGERNKG